MGIVGQAAAAGNPIFAACGEDSPSPNGAERRLNSRRADHFDIRIQNDWPAWRLGMAVL
jgi:hypothetical protein